jgi:hypothetical protein
MIKSQSTWNQPLNFVNVLKSDIITLYFDCILAITSNVLTNILMQHMVLVSPNFEFFKKWKKFTI